MGRPPKGRPRIQYLPAFCVPANDVLLGLWDRIADRLYKIRHCLNIDGIPRPPAATLRPFGRHPAVARDVSFFVDETVPAARIRALVEENRPPILEDLRVAEDYREPGKVPAGKKGMLWSMTYRAEGRTLTDAEVDAAHETLVTRLITELAAERR